MKIIKNFIKNRYLIYSLTKRDISSKYKGSILGIGWSFLNPIMMLCVYTFVFSFVFKAKWNIKTEESMFDFAIMLFIGLIAFNLFSEVVGKSPSLISSNINFVKKVVFPLEILPLVSVLTSIFQAFISFFIFLAAYFLINFELNLTVLLFPIIILPLAILGLGCSFFIASLSVYLKDIHQFIAIIVSTLLFLSPVFYPIEVIPKSLHLFFYLNPITFIVEQLRIVLAIGDMPNFIGLILYYFISTIILFLGYLWFNQTKDGFADVL